MQKKDRDSRTIFVGNVNIKTKKSEITNLFKPFGEV